MLISHVRKFESYRIIIRFARKVKYFIECAYIAQSYRYFFYVCFVTRNLIRFHCCRNRNFRRRKFRRMDVSPYEIFAVQNIRRNVSTKWFRALWFFVCLHVSAVFMNSSIIKACFFHELIITHFIMDL